MSQRFSLLLSRADEVVLKYGDNTDTLQVRLQIRPSSQAQVDTIRAMPNGRLWGIGDAAHDDQNASKRVYHAASGLYYP